MKLFPELEFHRTGIGLVADPHEPDRGSAVYLANVAGSQRPLTFCSCSAGRRQTCDCLTQLERQIKEFQQEAQGQSWHELFGPSLWHHLAQLLFEGDHHPFAEVRVLQEERDSPIRVVTGEGRELMRYLELSPATVRFLERIGKAPKKGSFVDRAGLIDRLSTFLRSPEEQHLNKAGLHTNRQSFEESLWCRLAYHCYREYADEGRFRPMIELRSGELFLEFRRGEISVLEMLVPRGQVDEVLALLAESASDRKETPIRPASLGELFDAEPDAKIVGPDGKAASPKLRETVALVQAHGRESFLEEEGAERWRYGGLAFIEPLSILGRDDGRPDDLVESLDLSGSGIATFRTEAPDLERADELLLEDPKADLGIVSEFDYIEIVPAETSDSDGEELDDRDDEHAVTVFYGFGDTRVTLGELLRAKKAGQPYLETDVGWIDLNAPALRGLKGLLKRKALLQSVRAAQRSGEREKVRLTSAELLRLQASSAKPVRVEGPRDRSELLERFLNLRPTDGLVLPEGFTSQLRPYQRIGVEWLKFLFENRLAGLLCDDMGLGKTHQAMALMVLLREQFDVSDPFLVVCPRTVISHWRNKIREFAPALHAVHYHGPHRNLEQALSEGDVLLTSYGVLRNDARKFKKRKWGLLVFDEIQQIKNRSTQGYQAALTVKSRMKLGLTGTPIENSLTELKSLFDLILPGYLGSEEDFRDRYGASPMLDEDSWRLANLRRLTAPFVLRRLKTAVLDELPEKIEDTRTCTLSEEQLSLYRQTISTKGVALMEKLRQDKEPLPYIHIFALLNLLKQICDHPALALSDLPNYESHDSGKWDLYQELLQESLASGQKVVVFTQYLGMIAIMERHLEQLGVEWATLTGASRNRGDLVDRFNHDPDCRVFLGSLKAGGTGIDLVGGSVVIHYDRWWNAAREDQATDRLYRIGQKRVVQVFKLVTEDTLEERIAAIIDRKRRLMEEVVQEDDPRLNKIFTREELIELLRRPDDEEGA